MEMQRPRGFFIAILTICFAFSGCLGSNQEEEGQIQSLAYLSIEEVIIGGINHPVTANIRGGDLDGNGEDELWVTEPIEGRINRIWNCNPTCLTETITTGVVQPVRTHVSDINGDGSRDLIVADIGMLHPSDDLVGRVVILQKNGSEWNATVVLEGVGRVTCAEAGDLDGDGDLDLAVCIFGHEKVGELLWMEQTSPLQFTRHRLDGRPGAIHAHPIDIDADGDLDLTVALAQRSEEVQLWRNDGNATFSKEIIHNAEEPWFGLSGIQTRDVDLDGDPDVIMTNGDMWDGDTPSDMIPSEHHGLSWFENDGTGAFTRHVIGQHAGSYDATAIDVDGDCDLDFVLVSMMDPNPSAGGRQNGMAWFERISDTEYVHHEVENTNRMMVSVLAIDLDGDGYDEIYSGTHDPMQLFDEGNVLERYHTNSKECATSSEP